MADAPPPRWCLRDGKALVLDRPRLMAVLNVTPDSFYAGSRVPGVEEALRQALTHVQAGADMLDIGGESTRPGASRVDADEQIRRVVPVIEAIRRADRPLRDIPISVDTTRVEVARLALASGADAINDVSGGEEGGEDLLRLAAASGAGLVLMHRRVPPDRDEFSDQYRQAPTYEDVVQDVRASLTLATDRAKACGVSQASIVLDPGLGFGKTVDQNLELVRRNAELASIGCPILSATSRKSFVGRVSCPDASQTDPSERLPGSLACTVAHLWTGARVFRVHDVGEQAAALRAAWAILRASS